MIPIMGTGATEASGQFWLPGKADEKTGGTILINPDGTAELKLGDIVSGDYEHHVSRAKVQIGTPIPPTRILGNASGIGDVTLEHCFASPMKFYPMKPSREPTDYEVGYVLSGALWEEGEAVEFNTLFFSIEGLNEWIGKSGFTFQDIFTSSVGYGIRFTPPSDIKLGSWDDLDISIRYSWQGPSVRAGVSDIAASQQAHFRLDATTPRSFEHLYATASRLRDFVSLGVGRNLLFTSMTGYLNHLGMCIDGKFNRHPIRVHFRDTRQRDDERIPYHSDMLFEFEATQNKSGSRFVDWLENYDRHHEPIDQYFGVFERPSVTWAQQFRSMFQVVETLFAQSSVEKKMPRAEVRRIVKKINSSFADEPDVAELVSDAFRNSNKLSARERLQCVLSENLDIRLDAPVIRAASRLIVRTRDELTHVAGADTADFYINHRASIKIDVLDTIIRIWLLRLAGFGIEDALSIVEQRPLLWHRVAGLVKSEDKTLEQMPEEVWWKRP